MACIGSKTLAVVKAYSSGRKNGEWRLQIIRWHCTDDNDPKKSPWWTPPRLEWREYISYPHGKTFPTSSKKAPSDQDILDALDAWIKVRAYEYHDG